MHLCTGNSQDSRTRTCLYADNTQAEIAEMRKIARSPAIEPAITGSYQELVKPKLVGGSMRLSFPNRLMGAR